MSYGKTLEEVDTRKDVSQQETDYGFRAEIIKEPEFSLAQIKIKRGRDFSYNSTGEVLFIEEGKVSFDEKILEKGNVIFIPENSKIFLKAAEDSFIYSFSGKVPFHNLEVSKTSDIREKYWGKIETIFSGNFAAKRIELLPNKPGSLEYHINKKEAYYVHSGEVRIGVRVGRAENKSLILKQNQAFLINRGVMHSRFGIKPSVIIEISTKDDDSDSNLVEDGSKGYMHE